MLLRVARRQHAMPPKPESAIPQPACQSRISSTPLLNQSPPDACTTVDTTKRRRVIANMSGRRRRMSDLRNTNRHEAVQRESIKSSAMVSCHRAGCDAFGRASTTRHPRKATIDHLVEAGIERRRRRWTRVRGKRARRADRCNVQSALFSHMATRKRGAILGVAARLRQTRCANRKLIPRPGSPDVSTCVQFCTPWRQHCKTMPIPLR